MRKKRKVINLFEDTHLSSVKYVVSIATEEDLNQFWDFLLGSENSTHYVIHTFISLFYSFSLKYLKDDNLEFFEIILEENEEFLYFTLWNKKVSIYFMQHIDNSSLEFLHVKNKLSIKLKKEKISTVLKPLHKKEIKKIIKVIEPYTFLQDDDLQDLIKLNDDLQEVVYQLKKHGFYEGLFITFRSTLSIFCLTLRYYSQIKIIANTITDFSNLINTHKENFLELSDDELALIIGFINNIETWLHTLFIKGGANISFMDNSIQADYNTIVQMIEPPKLLNEDFELDDIFDF